MRFIRLFCPVLLCVAALNADAQNQPTRWTNSLGMVFVPVPKTEVKFCIWETRIQDYAVFVKEGQWARSWPTEKPDFEQGPTHPVVNVSWQDSKEFCIWLTQREQQQGLISSNQVYRLPTDREWNTAVGIPIEDAETAEKRGHTSHFVGPITRDATPKPSVWDNNYPGNYSGGRDGFKFTAPVGSFEPNALGIYDLTGNVWEWCMDFADDGRRHILRGGSWRHGALPLYEREYTLPSGPVGDFGFRVVLYDVSPAP
jgi:formylglycine-generating enzyme required for sulfatase activity